MVSVATWALPAGKLPQPVAGILCIQDTGACPACWQLPFSSNKPGAAQVCSLATAGPSSGRHNTADAAALSWKAKQDNSLLVCSAVCREWTVDPKLHVPHGWSEGTLLEQLALWSSCSLPTEVGRTRNPEGREHNGKWFHQWDFRINVSKGRRGWTEISRVYITGLWE